MKRMNKFVPIIIAVLLIACKKKPTEIVPENSITKKVEYKVFAAKDYSAPLYANIKADLRLQIRKINFRTGETQLLWDSSFATKYLTEFPQAINKIIIEKYFPVFESKEKLNGSFVIKYDDSGYISQFGHGDDVVPGEMSTLLEVHL